MKKIILSFLCITLFSCASKSNRKSSSIIFNDCIDFFYKPQLFLHLEINSTYKVSDDTFGASWETDRGYGFISNNDTISISVRFEKSVRGKISLEPENLDEEKKSLGRQLYFAWHCSIQDYIPMDFFFKGKCTTCTGGYSELLTYYGYYYDSTTNYDVGIGIRSWGKTITKEREENFKQMIETIKVDLVPR